MLQVKTKRFDASCQMRLPGIFVTVIIAIIIIAKEDDRVLLHVCKHFDEEP